MKETRMITYKCGHEKEATLEYSVSIYKARDRKKEKWVLDSRFRDLMWCDCEECRKKNGITAKMEIGFKDGEFIAYIITDSYNYKDILKECGMKYRENYGWHYSFPNRNYKELLDKKIEILKEHKIIITKIIEDEDLEAEEKKYYKSIAMKKLKNAIMEIIPDDIDKNSDEYKSYKEMVKTEMNRISVLSTEELINYEYNPENSDNNEINTRIEERNQINALREEAIKEVKAKTLTPRPGFADEGRWNQKFYGSKDNRSVYIDGNKRSITEEEYNQWIAYEKSAENFNRIRDIISKMSIEQLQNKEYLIEIDADTIRETAVAQAKKDILKSKPSCIDGYWNGNYYGKSKRDIYINNERYTLNDEEYQLIQDYQNSIKKFNEIKKTIITMSLVDLKNEEYKKLYA